MRASFRTGNANTMIFERRIWLPVLIATVLIDTVLMVYPSSGAHARNLLTLATTTSTDNSGLLAHLHPDFERKTQIVVKVIAKGTGAALQLARDGNADVVLVHAREQEDRFVAEGFGISRHDVMYNDFVILGPKDDPAKVQGVKSPARALRRVAAAAQTFVSRGDGSGTHIKEQQLWRQTGLPLQSKTARMFAGGARKELRSVQPSGRWYWSIGQGMGKTIMVATEKRAYTLADRGTYYAFALAKPPRTDLTVVCQGNAALHNPYGVIAVNPAKHPKVNFPAATAYIRWITSPAVQAMIGRYTLQGKVLFHPAAASEKKSK